MEQRGSHYRKPFFFALATFFVLAIAGTYFFQVALVVPAQAGKYIFAIGGYVVSASAHTYIIVLSILAAILISLAVFLIAATRQRAGQLAERLTGDLLSSRELFVQLYQSSPVPYLLLSAEGEITFPNAAALRLFGVKSDELIGTVLFDYFAAEGQKQQQHVDLIPSRFQQGAPVADDEVQIVRPDGSPRWILLSLFPFTKTDGGHNGLAALVDITKQKEIERAKSEFVSLASHQLRTPLSSLKWHLELLSSPRTGELSHKQQKHIETIRRGVKRLDDIVEDFLNVSRLELGTMKPARESLHVPSLIEEIMHDLSSEVSARDHIVEQDVRINVLTSSRKFLRMVLENLISNAVRYTQNGGHIVIRAVEEGGTAVFEVSDNGMGIPKDEQDEVFSKMFRASNVRESVPGGTGLGLYICRLIVRMLGGSITFTSTPGEGTVFTVRLPLA